METSKNRYKNKQRRSSKRYKVPNYKKSHWYEASLNFNKENYE